MKRFKKIYISALTCTAILSACNKQLDQKPFQQIEQGQALLTSDDVKITLVGAYSQLSNQNLFGGGALLGPDLLSSQGASDWQGTFLELTQLVAQTIPNDNVFVANLWISAYAEINSLNNVLSAIDKVDAANRDRVEGEAKFLRALTYFDLVRLFGKDYGDGDPASNPGVPLVLTPTKQIDESSYVARASVKQVYDQVIADLTDAVNKMPESNGFFANKYAASAILARVYLQKGDYANAANAATDVISADAYELNEDYADEFPNPGQVHVDDTPEDIFAIQITTQTGAYDGNTASYLNTNWMNAFYASADNAGRGEIIIKDSFLESFEEGDERLTVFNPDGDGFLRVDKFNNVFGNVHIIRLAELYLIRAEANLRISGSSSIGDTPLNDVNMIRDRANLEPLAVVTINNVLTERLHELAFEGGFFLHDARRNKQNINNLPYNSPKLVFPIPLREINANPKLVQNPGYSSN